MIEAVGEDCGGMEKHIVVSVSSTPPPHPLPLSPSLSLSSPYPPSPPLHTPHTPHTHHTHTTHTTTTTSCLSSRMVFPKSTKLQKHPALFCVRSVASLSLCEGRIFSIHAASVNRGRQCPCVAQAPTCPDPSRRVRSAVGGRLRPTRVSPCEDESHDHVTTVHFWYLEDGIQGARHGVPASAGLASSSGVGGSRSAEERCSSTVRPGCACDHR